MGHYRAQSLRCQLCQVLLVRPPVPDVLIRALCAECGMHEPDNPLPVMLVAA